MIEKALDTRRELFGPAVYYGWTVCAISFAKDNSEGCPGEKAMGIRLDMRRYGCPARRRTCLKGEDRPLRRSEDFESAVKNCGSRMEEFRWKMLIRLPIEVAWSPPEDYTIQDESPKNSQIIMTNPAIVGGMRQINSLNMPFAV
jgi:hypothetical protein